MKGRLRLFPRAAFSALFHPPRPAYQIRRFSTPLEDEKKDWNWVPPRQQQTPVDKEAEIDTKPEVIQGQYFTPEEVASLIENLKGMDVRVVKINGKLDGITHFIIGSGESSRHLQSMADSLVRTVRERRLLKAPSFKYGAEGTSASHWMVVDMFNVVAHLMMPKTRKRYNLEAHWSAPSRPFAVYRKGPNDKKSEERYQDSLDDLCNQYPPPQDEDNDDTEGVGDGQELDGEQEGGVDGYGNSRGRGHGSGSGGRLTQVHSSGFVFSKPPKDFPK